MWRYVNWKLTAILLVVSGVLFFYSFGDFFTSFQKPVDFNEVTAAEIKPGIHVNGEVSVLLDAFASEETWTENKDGSKTPKKTSHKYYIIPVGEQEFMGIEASAPDFKAFDKMVDETYAALSGAGSTVGENGRPFDGTVVKMDEESLGFMREWFTESGAADSEIDEMVLPLMLEHRDFNMVRIVFIIAVTVLLIAVFQVWFTLFRRKKALARRAAAEASATVGPDIP